MKRYLLALAALLIFGAGMQAQRELFDIDNFIRELEEQERPAIQPGSEEASVKEEPAPPPRVTTPDAPEEPGEQEEAAEKELTELQKQIILQIAAQKAAQKVIKKLEQEKKETKKRQRFIPKKRRGRKARR